MICKFTEFYSYNDMLWTDFSISHYNRFMYFRRLGRYGILSAKSKQLIKTHGARPILFRIFVETGSGTRHGYMG